MSATIDVPSHLTHLVDDQKIIEVEGKTVRECLLNLSKKYPAILPELFDINGDIAVIVLHEAAPLDDATLDAIVKNGDSIQLFPIIIGG